MEKTERFQGVVAWFNRGYGFIKPNDPEVNDGKDLFVHFTQIVSEATFKTLTAGQTVLFSLGSNKNGIQAEQVEVIAEPEL